MRNSLSEITAVAPLRVIALMGICIAIVAEITAALTLAFVYIAFPLTFNRNIILFLICAPVASILVGLSTWWRFIAKPRHVTIGRGIGLGILIGIIAHPLAWLCFMVLSSILNIDFLPRQPLPDLPSLLMAVIPFSLFGLVYVGWITVAIGGIAGGLLIVIMRHVSWQDNSRSEDRIRQERM